MFLYKFEEFLAIAAIKPEGDKFHHFYNEEQPAPKLTHHVGLEIINRVVFIAVEK